MMLKIMLNVKKLGKAEDVNVTYFENNQKSNEFCIKLKELLHLTLVS